MTIEREPGSSPWWKVAHRERDAIVHTYALGSREDLQWAIDVGEFRDVQAIERVRDVDLVQRLDASTEDQIDGCYVMSIGSRQYYHRGM